MTNTFLSTAIEPEQAGSAVDVEPHLQTKMPTLRKLSALILVPLVILAYLLVKYGFHLGQDAVNDHSQDQNNTQIVPHIDRRSFAEILADNCQNDQVALTALPLDFSISLKVKYHLTNTIPCFGSTNDILQGSSNSTRFLEAHQGISDDNIDDSILYVFHPQSVYEGYSNPIAPAFKAEEEFPNKGEEVNFAVEIAGHTYWLRFIGPGPAGWTSLNSRIAIVGDKQFDNNRATIRVENFRVLALEDWRRLMKKYGQMVSAEEIAHEPSNSPLYTINNTDLVKKRAFFAEVVPLVTQRPEVIQMATEVQNDLDGITELFPE